MGVGSSTTTVLRVPDGMGCGGEREIYDERETGGSANPPNPLIHTLDETSRFSEFLVVSLYIVVLVALFAWFLTIVERIA